MRRFYEIGVLLGPGAHAGGEQRWPGADSDRAVPVQGPAGRPVAGDDEGRSGGQQRGGQQDRQDQEPPLWVLIDMIPPSSSNFFIFIRIIPLLVCRHRTIRQKGIRVAWPLARETPKTTVKTSV